MSARGPFETLEGIVKSAGERSLWFRETGSDHDICIPLSQVRDAEAIEKGALQIDVSKWILNKLDEEGKR